MKSTVKNRSRMDVLGYMTEDKPIGDQVIFKLTNRTPGRTTEVSFRPIDTIMLPQLDDNNEVIKGPDGKPRLSEATIVYIEGYNTIFLDEILESTGMTEKEVFKKIKFIEAANDIVCSPTEVNKIAYLRATNLNQDQPYRKTKKKYLFREYNPDAENRRLVEKRRREFVVVQQVVNLIEAKKHGILTAMAAVIMNRPIDAVRRQTIGYIENFMIRVTDRQPEKVQKLFSDRRSMNKMILLEAIDKEIVKEVREGAHHAFVMDGETLFIASPGSNVLEAAASGMKEIHMARVERKVGPMIESDQKEEDEKNRMIRELQEKLDKREDAEAFMSNATKDDIDAISKRVRTPGIIKEEIAQLVEDGVIDKKGIWYKHPKLPTQLYQKEGSTRNALTIDEIVEAFMKDAKLFNEFMEAAKASK